MPALFLHSPYDDPAVLATILGGRPEAGAPEAGVAASLDGHVLARDGNGLAAAPVAGPGQVDGRLLTLAGPERARLDFAMAALGLTPSAVEVATGDGRVAAAGYRFAGAVPDGAGEATQLPWLVEALAEVMGHFGSRTGAAMRPLFYGIAVRALGRSRGPERASPVALGTALAAGDATLVERRHPYTRYFAVEEHLLRHRRFDGGCSETIERAIFTSGDAVVVLPYDPVRDAVLLIEQFRAGPWARSDPRPWRLETVAGRCDRAEPVEATARREAREEAGLELGRLERIAGFYPSPAIMSEYITAFVGEADLGAAGGTFGLPEEHEDIRAQVVPLEAALAAVASGEIDTAPLMLALSWLAANAPRLRRDWG